TARFRATLSFQEGSPVQNVESIPVGDRQVACFAPRQAAADAQLHLERYTDLEQQVRAEIRFLAAEPVLGECGTMTTGLRDYGTTGLRDYGTTGLQDEGTAGRRVHG